MYIIIIIITIPVPVPLCKLLFRAIKYFDVVSLVIGLITVKLSE